MTSSSQLKASLSELKSTLLNYRNNYNPLSELKLWSLYNKLVINFKLRKWILAEVYLVSYIRLHYYFFVEFAQMFEFKVCTLRKAFEKSKFSKGIFFQLWGSLWLMQKVVFPTFTRSVQKIIRLWVFIRFLYSNIAYLPILVDKTIWNGWQSRHFFTHYSKTFKHIPYM